MRILIAAALLLTPALAQAEVTDQSAAGFQIRHVAEIAAPPAKVRADIQEIGRWWNSGHTYSGDAGNLAIDAAGCFCEALADGFVRHMTVVYSDARALRMFGGLGPMQTTGAAGHLGLQVEAAPGDPGRTRLTLSYDVGGYARGGLAETWARPVDAVLGEQVSRLKAYAETGRPD